MMRALVAAAVAASMYTASGLAAERSMAESMADRQHQHAEMFRLARLNMTQLGMMEQSEVASSAARINAELEKLNVTDSGAQFALYTLKKSLRKMDKLDPDGIATLQNVSSLLDDIMALYLADATAQQAIIDDYQNQIAACWATLPAVDDHWRGVANESAQNHTDCRSEELNLFNIDVTECGEFLAVLNGLYEPACNNAQNWPGSLNGGSPNTSHIPEWTTFIDQGELWFNNTLAAYVPVRDDCVESTKNLEDQIVVCNGLQDTYENNVCTWRGFHKQNCISIDGCDSSLRSQYAALEASVMPTANQRVMLVQLIEYVQCLVDNFVSGVLDKSQCMPMEALSTLQQYNNTFPDLGTKPTCTMAEVTPYPGATEWYNHAYSHLDANTPAVDPAHHDCPDGF